MEAYTNFAQVYDTFMDNVPYKKWADYIEERLRKHGITDGLVLELGCGTGNMTGLLAGAGYDMIGIDSAGDMLEIAMDKRLANGYDILYLQQDMRAFELYGTVAAVISVCDSVNYVMEPAELQEVFRLVNNYLDPGGLFFFDFNTVYKYREVIGNQVIAEEREQCSFIWDNDYDEEDQVNAYELTLFVQCPQDTSLYRKYQECHYQRGYTLEEMKQLLHAAGLTLDGAWDAYTKKPPTMVSERICIIARECMK